MKIECKDPVVARVLAKMAERSRVGQEKYGQTIQDEIETDIKNVTDYVIDVQEELMDAILYLEAVKATLPKAIKFVDEFMEKNNAAFNAEVERQEERMKIIGQNGNDGLHYTDDNYAEEMIKISDAKKDYTNDDGDGPAMFRSVYPGDAFVSTPTHNID